MKYLLAFILIGCAFTPINDENRLKHEFKVATACEASISDVRTIAEERDFAGNYTRGSYAYSCGEKEYACQIWRVQYSYHRRCVIK